jgi:hypothetical protein
MDTDIQTLKDLYKISYEAYQDSRQEADEIDDLFHNRQYTENQLAVLANRGQPAETFNVVKMFGRLILGYYSTVVNTIKVSPVQTSDVLTSSLLNDVVDYTMRVNRMETEGDKIKLDGLLTGLMCCYITVEKTDKTDEFGRTINKVIISHVPAKEIAIDPLSRLEDYSDGRYIHRWKWVAEEQLKKLFPKKKKVIEEELEPYENHLNTDQSEFTSTFNEQFDGIFKKYNSYLLVHTIIKDDKDKTWSIYWCGDVELDRKEVTYKEVKFPYRVHKIHTSSKTEYYGIFREVKETQKAINQALLKIQLMVNTQKAFLEEGAVENIEEFTDAFNRVNAVIPVKKLSKIKIENLTRDVLDQYTVIDRALDRIQRVLGVNDSFLGMAYASDSGRKVKLQQNATSLALRYISVRIEQFYRLLGWDLVNLVKQYYTASQVMRIVDESVGERWIALNQPMKMWTGRFDAQGQPVFDLVWEEVLDPETNEPMLDKEGRIIIAPVPEKSTEIAFTDVDIDIDSVTYNDEDEKNQLMLETILQGSIGNALMQVNPAGFFRAAALTIKSMKTKHSIDIHEVLNQTSQMLAGGAPPPVLGSGDSPKSPSMSLPQNTRSDQ